MTANENRDPALCNEFVRAATDILSHYPDILHEWSIDDDEDHCILYLPKNAHDGFDIIVEVFSTEIIVNTDGPHLHLDLVESPNRTVNRALCLVRDLLSPDMRIVEKCANGKPYKWLVQILRNGNWYTEQTSSLLFFNFIGRRSERIFMNRTLPGRLSNSDT